MPNTICCAYIRELAMPYETMPIQVELSFRTAPLARRPLPLAR